MLSHRHRRYRCYQGAAVGVATRYLLKRHSDVWLRYRCVSFTERDVIPPVTTYHMLQTDARLQITIGAFSDRSIR